MPKQLAKHEVYILELNLVEVEMIHRALEKNLTLNPNSRELWEFFDKLQ